MISKDNAAPALWLAGMWLGSCVGGGVALDRHLTWTGVALELASGLFIAALGRLS